MWQEMHSSAAGWGLASAASPRIVRHRGGAPGDIVRIVAGGAGELPGAGQEAGRFPQTVGRTGELEFIVVAGAGRVIEMQRVFFQRLSRAVGKDTPVEARDGRGESQGGGLQVALQADFHAADGVEPGRIHDGAAHFVPRSAPLHGLDVGFSGTVTALAIDALRHALGEYGGAVPLRRGLDFGIGVVAEHARVIDLAAETRVVRPRVSRAHAPMAAGFGVPGGGEFQQLAGRGARKVAARVVAGTNPVVQGPFEGTVVLLAPQVSLAAAYRQGEYLLGRLVAECAARNEWQSGARRDGAEGSRHAGAPIGFGDLRMTRGAGLRVHVPRLRRRGTEHQQEYGRQTGRGAGSNPRIAP